MLWSCATGLPRTPGRAARWLGCGVSSGPGLPAQHDCNRVLGSGEQKLVALPTVGIGPDQASLIGLVGLEVFGRHKLLNLESDSRVERNVVSGEHAKAVSCGELLRQ